MKAYISVMTLWIVLKFGMECVLSQGTFHSKTGAASFRLYTRNHLIVVVNF